MKTLTSTNTNQIKAKYSNEAFFKLNIDKLSVRGSMLPLMLAKELNSSDRKNIIDWFEQDETNEVKIANFKNYFNVDYSSLKYNYVDYLDALTKNNCEFTLCREHLNLVKTKNEVISKMLILLSFIGDEVKVEGNFLIIDKHTFEIEPFLDAYIGTCNVLLSPKIKEASLAAYGVSSLSLFDIFIIKLLSSFIDYEYSKKKEFNSFIELISEFYPKDALTSKNY